MNGPDRKPAQFSDLGGGSALDEPALLVLRPTCSRKPIEPPGDGRANRPRQTRSLPPAAIARRLPPSGTVSCNTLATLRKSFCGGGRPARRTSRSWRRLAWFATTLAFLMCSSWAFRCSRQLNYVARSTLFVPILGPLIRSVGRFPDPARGYRSFGNEGNAAAAQGRRHRGSLSRGDRAARTESSVRSSRGSLHSRPVGVPVVPAGLAGMFESWPRTRPFPVPHPVRIHYGAPILPSELRRPRYRRDHRFDP